MTDDGEPNPAVGAGDGQTNDVLPDRNRPRSGLLLTLTRLSIGGTLLAVEALTDRLQQWEQELMLALPDRQSAGTGPDEPATEEPALTDSRDQPVRYALLGLIFASQPRLSRARTTFRQAERAAGRITELTVNPLSTSRTLAPVRGRFQTLVERGEAEVARWAALGQAEEAYSRALAQTALNQLLESFVDRVAENRQLQEIIHTQSLGLADEAIDEVRERTVSADFVLERFTRSLLRRPPRTSRPGSTSKIDN